MKKTLWMFLMVLMATTLWAKGTGTGADRDNAIEFSWKDGVTIPRTGVAVWYRIDLADVSEFEQPNLVLRLENPSTTDSMTVDFNLYYEKSVESRSYKVAPNSTKTWSASVGMLKVMKITEVFLEINASQKSEINAKLDEKEDVDDACLNAVSFNAAGSSVGAASTRWFEMDLNSLTSDQVYVLTYKNKGSEETVVTRQLSPTCPVSSPANKTLVIPAGAGQTVTDTISCAMLSLLGTNPYLGIKSSCAITVTGAAATASVQTGWLTYATVDQDPDVWVGLPSATSYYRVARTALLDRRKQPQISFDNEANDTEATVTVDIIINGKTTAPIEYITHVVTVAAGEIGTLDLSRDLVMAIPETVEYIYVRITSTQSMQAMWRMKHLHEGDKCKYATAINWNETQYQDANTEVWYELDITDAKTNINDIKATIINRAGTQANVHGQLVFECPYNDMQEMSRTLSANDTVTKEIPYSTFSTIATKDNKIWLGIQTDQAVAIKIDTIPATKLDPEESEACKSAILFDWNNGHVQNANDSIWYKVPMDTLRNAVKNDLLPYATISNRGEAGGTFYVAYTTVCPAQTAYAERELSISAYSTVEKLISVDMINNFDKSIDTVYFRVSGTQDCSFQVKMQKQNEGVSCANPILFNWVTGNDYTAEEPVWYLIDLTEAKKTDKDMEIVLLNRSKTSGTIHGELATICPCSTTDKKSMSVRAGDMKIDTIPHATIESFGDSLWLKVTANVDLHIEVHMITPAPFDTIWVCDKDSAGTQQVQFGQNYTVTDTTWFYVLTDTINHTPLTPQVTLKNGTTAQTIKAEVAYHCPVTATMMEQNASFGAGKTKTKLLERTTAESLAAQHDTIWIRLSSSMQGTFQFRVDLIDPNDGHDCAHAMYLEPDTAFVQQANQKLWYYLDAQKLIENHKYLDVIFKNLNATDGGVILTAQGDCDSEELLSHNLTLAAGSTLADTLQAGILPAFGSQYIYLSIRTQQEDSIRLVARQQEPIEALTACEEAKAILLNKDYNLTAGTTQWYSLNIRNLADNYKGDLTMHMYNLSEDPMQAKAAMVWECPTTYKPVDKTISIEAGGEYLEDMTLAQLQKIDSGIVYIRLSADQDMLFRLDMELAAGDRCSNAIIFDWENGNIHPTDGYLYYEVEIDTARIGKHDLRLHIDNLTDESVTATCAIKPDCLDDPLATVSFTFSPDDNKYKDIDLDLILLSTNIENGKGKSTLYYNSTNTTHIWVELIPEAADIVVRDTITAYVCNLDEYVDTVKNTTHTIKAYDRSSLTWNDTIQFQEGTYLGDTIITFIITPIVLPDSMDFFNSPEELDALPICMQGLPIFTDTATAILMRHYAATTRIPVEGDTIVPSDSIAPVIGIRWEIANPDPYAESGLPVNTVYPDYLKKETTVINRLRCVLELGGICGTEGNGYEVRSRLYDIPVIPWRTDSIVITDTVCAGFDYPQTGTYHVVVNGDMVDRITVPYVQASDTLGMQRVVDSIYIYNLTTWKMPLVKEINTLDSKSLPTAKIGESVKTTRMVSDIQYYCDNNYPYKDTVQVTEIIWEQKINDGEFTLYDNTYTLECGDTLITMHYGIVTDICVDTIWSSDYSFYSEHSLTEADAAWEVQDTICHDGTLELPFSKYTYTEPGIYNDTIINENGCDTIVAHVLTRLMLYVPSFNEDSAYVVCGQPVHVEAITAAVADSIANNDLLGVHYQSMTWEIQKGNEAWAELGTDALDASYDIINLRLTLHTECGDTAYEFSRDLEPASAENVAEYNTLPAETMFGDRMLMINLNGIMELLDGDTVLAEEVHWYRVMGMQDNIEFIGNEPSLVPADGDTKDSLVHTGYYYTLPEADQLQGNYYALIARQFQIDPKEGTCGYAMRTVIIETQAPANAPATRKVIERGNVVIITEEDNRFDTNGRKL